ncbi:hypothetical protein OIO90_004369 [Microbotryomycetes sp. JL221]|nr:hypothetical protein OIO90_004369 [Microbotryomycetes sp. JL221]
MVMATSTSSTNRVRLFNPRASTNSTKYHNHDHDRKSIQRLHTSLSTLLPILPLLASPQPSQTLLVTLATPAFKPLLFNWLCFLKHKAKWAQPLTRHNDNYATDFDDDDDDGDTVDPHEPLNVLIVTSDESLAKQLSNDKHNLVVWWIKPSSNDQEPDLFKTLRQLDLLLPPEPSANYSSSASSTTTNRMLEWGSLHYQSLMLERTLVMSTLVGALVESQQRDDDHDHDDDSGVKGVLLVDNDAVWLADPSPIIDHAFVPGSNYPSFVWAPDTSPTTKNKWDSYSLPCACFIYSRVKDVGVDLTLPKPTKQETRLIVETNQNDGNLRVKRRYKPSLGTALAWRWTALCHISMLMNSFEQAKNSALAMLDQQMQDISIHQQQQEIVSNTTSNQSQLKQLVKAYAPSFQATALGPALFLASNFPNSLGHDVSHQQWLNVISKGQGDELFKLLKKAGMGLNKVNQNQRRRQKYDDDMMNQREREEEEEEEDDDDIDMSMMMPFEDETEQEFFDRIGQSNEQTWLNQQTTNQETKQGLRTTCDEIAERLSNTCSVSNLNQDEFVTSLNVEYILSRNQLDDEDDDDDDELERIKTPNLLKQFKPSNQQIRTSSLPFDLFPPGMRYFGGGGISKGTKTCVVHANYATGTDKENLLRRKKLWALVLENDKVDSDEDQQQQEYMCDLDVINKAS